MGYDTAARLRAADALTEEELREIDHVVISDRVSFSKDNIIPDNLPARGLSPLEAYRRQERETNRNMEEWAKRIGTAAARSGQATLSKETVERIGGGVYHDDRKIGILREAPQTAPSYGQILTVYRCRKCWRDYGAPITRCACEGGEEPLTFKSASETPAPNELDEDATAWFQRMMSQD
jgi:hypothetical protein